MSRGRYSYHMGSGSGDRRRSISPRTPAPSLPNDDFDLDGFDIPISDTPICDRGDGTGIGGSGSPAVGSTPIGSFGSNRDDVPGSSGSEFAGRQQQLRLVGRSLEPSEMVAGVMRRLYRERLQPRGVKWSKLDPSTIAFY